jgi:hypothetical protein
VRRTMSPPNIYPGRKERKMDISIVTEFINGVGFPIACVAAMFWMQNQEREQHRQEAEKFAEAINNNTQVMTRILEKLGVSEE